LAATFGAMGYGALILIRKTRPAPKTMAHRIDCPACGSDAAMAPASIARMPALARACGWVLMIIGLLGLFVSLALAPLARGGTLAPILLIALGAILLWRRRVWQCITCGHYIARA